MAQKPRLLILTGTTASGKSAFLYRNFRDLPLSVINADSRQVYSDLRISSASPAESELSLFHHELYNFLPLDAIYSAGTFATDARQAIIRALSAGRFPVVCGGTFFYIQSLLSGLLPPIPVPEDIRQQVEALSETEAWQQFNAIDPVAAARVHRHNRVRMNRQLMLCLAHGGPISAIERAGGIAEDFDIMMLVFAPEREALRERVSTRVGQMFAGGIVGEADGVVRRSLAAGLDWHTLPALTGIGTSEFFAAYSQTGKLPSELDREQLAAVGQSIITNTMQLVKRQMTWFRNSSAKPPNTKTVDPSYEHELIAALARDFMQVRA
ncbi:MAG: tRNA (adenosine(37)-N6)-dimethylallyltransferase MiaA [Spirochaetota bacterium]